MSEISLTYDDVLLVPNYNHYESRRLVSTAITDMTGKLTLKIPLMTSNMDTITEENMANFIGEKGGLGIIHRFMSIDENVTTYKKCKYQTGVAVGCSDKEMERVEALKNAGAMIFNVDVAHAHARYVGRMVKRMREFLGEDACIIAGNVATYAGADFLASCGADVIKVGIGGGSVCSTRIKTGFGVPMLSCLKECARVGRSLIADGGARTPGDFVKALAFGADFIMCGGIWAGTRPTPGPIITDKDGMKWKEYRGMASREAQEDFQGFMGDWKTAEGVSTMVPYREDEENILADILGGLRSGLTYGGAKDIRELQKKLNYIQVTQAGIIESHPHKTFQKGVQSK